MADQQKQTVADAAIKGAERGVRLAIGGTHDVELTRPSKLEGLLRVKRKGSDEMSTYYVVKVSKPI